MTQTAHTPGIWKADVTDQGYSTGHGPYVAVCDESGRSLAHVFCFDRRGADRPYAADAHLIATAPDLLRLCELVNDSFGGGRTITFTDSDIEDFAAVIAKAKGGAA